MSPAIKGPKPLPPRDPSWFNSVLSPIFRRKKTLTLSPPPRRTGIIQTYLFALLITAVATFLAYLVELLISPTNLVMIYILAVMIAAVILGRGPSILVSVLGVLLFDFLFIPPYYTFAVDDTEYIITFAGLLIVGLVISALNVTAREQTEEAQARERDTLTLYALSSDLSNTLSIEELANVVITHFPPTFNARAALYLPINGKLAQFPENTAQHLSAAEAELAEWCYKYRQPSGLGTTILPSLEPRFIPLTLGEKIYGVLSMTPKDPTKILPDDQQRLFDAFVNQVCLALERQALNEQARQVEMLRAAEKLQNALLNSISHDLRTPLVTITGTLTALEADGIDLSDHSSRDLITSAREEADRLNRLVGNLLDMTRLEAGTVIVKRQHVDLIDLIGAALQPLNQRLGDREVNIKVPKEAIFPMDFVLVVHVLTNLIDNADKYSKPNTPISISAEIDTAGLTMRVTNEDGGLSKYDPEMVFEKFYRGLRSNQISGTGLGLAICKGFVEAHGGRIWADSEVNGTTVFTFNIPL